MPTTTIRRTKTAATLGLAWERPDQMHALLDAGVDVVRINASHGTPEIRTRWIQDLQAEAAPRLATLSSTTFDAQLDVAAKVAGENPDLYFEIQTLTDYGTESLAALLYAVERLRSVVRAHDLEGFRALITRGRAYLQNRERR